VDTKQATELRVRGLDIVVLTLGRPVGQRIQVQQTTSTAAMENNNNNNKPGETTATSSRTGHRSAIIQWKYAIQGGLLAAAPGGQLVVELQWPSSSPRSDDAPLHIASRLLDYRPTLVGTTTPSSPLRTALYLGSQSAIHGYVMWRFHRHVQRSIG
jgi:hypothetical protein